LRRPCANFCDSAVPAPPPLGGALNLVMGNVLEEKARICGRNRCGFVRGQIPTLWIDSAEHRRNRRKQKVNKLSQIDNGGFVRARTPALPGPRARHPPHVNFIAPSWPRRAAARTGHPEFPETLSWIAQCPNGYAQAHFISPCGISGWPVRAAARRGHDD
jgi:hypothetical protein